MKRTAKNQRGFTLVELLIALTIFAIGLLSVAGMQVTALQTNSNANTLSFATALAQGVMEDVLARPVDDPMFNSNAVDEAWDFGALTGVGGYSATYTVNLVNLGAVSVANMAQIGVTVTRPGGGTVTLVGYKRLI